MAYFHTNVLDNQIKALPTVDTASGSVASFDTDLTENLIECVCEIQYSQASGTPTPTNPIPITVYNSLNLSHSGADTSNPDVINIPFNQTVAKGTLNVTTGVLSIEWLDIEITGSEEIKEYVYSNTHGVWIADAIPTSETRPPYVSNMSLYSQSTIYRSGSIWCGANGPHLYWIGILDILEMTLEDFKTWISTHHLQVAYRLSTPLKIQLNSNQITALLNENNIWCDTNGDTSVKFLLTVGKKIA